MKSMEGVYVADSLARIGDYAKLGPNFAKAVAFLNRRDLKSLPNGRYSLDGENVVAIIQESTLKEWGTGRPEVHHEFFDIQVPFSGPEIIGVGRFDPSAHGDFDEERDIGFYDDVSVEPLTVRPGEFAILYPETCAHAPCCGEVGGDVIRKVVVKVRRQSEEN